MSTAFVLASGSCPTDCCQVLMLFWEVVWSFTCLFEHFGFSRTRWCNKPCLDGTLQTLLSAWSSASLWALLAFLVERRLEQRTWKCSLLSTISSEDAELVTGDGGVYWSSPASVSSPLGWMGQLLLQALKSSLHYICYLYLCVVYGLRCASLHDRSRHSCRSEMRTEVQEKQCSGWRWLSVE